MPEGFADADLSLLLPTKKKMLEVSEMDDDFVRLHLILPFHREINTRVELKSAVSDD